MGLLVQVGSAVFLLTLILLAPLRLILGWTDADAAGLSARRVEGTMWAGRLHGAAYRGAPLGDARVGLDAIGLLTGKPGLRVAADGEVKGRGTVRLAGDRFGLARVDATLPLQTLAPRLPIRGELVLGDLQVEFRKGACRSAHGAVALRSVSFGTLGQAVPGLRLSGAAACRDGQLNVPLAGQASGVAIESVLRVDGAGRYVLTSRLRATDPLALAAAGAAGFERGLDGFTRTDRGVLHAGL